MKKSLLIIRLIFFLLCILGSWLITYTNQDLGVPPLLVVAFGISLGLLVILVDVYLKGFSLRGLSALTFGLAIGALIATIISVSPLFAPLKEDPDFRSNIYLVQLILFVVCMYLGAVISLRGKDEFNLVIPYVRFVPHEVNVPLAVLDTSALIDGRIAAICASRWMVQALVIPRFVLEELHRIADAGDPTRQARGRRGLDVLNELRSMKHMDVRIHESDVSERNEVDAKLIFVAQNLKGYLVTTDYNLAKLAEFHGVTWLNIHALSKALVPEVEVGRVIEVDLVKPGKEDDQAVGFLRDGSMVVVLEARNQLGKTVQAEVTSILPSGGGKMIFARLLETKSLRGKEESV